MKPENKFRTWFVEKFRGWLHQVHPGATFVARKHADYATGGILDMSLTVNGITVWTEFKLIPKIEKERKLDVSELQRAEIDEYSRAGAPVVVLVGLPLGPRKGYDVAFYNQAVPEKAYRNDFGCHTDAFDYVYSLAEKGAQRALDKFLTQAFGRR